MRCMVSRMSTANVKLATVIGMVFGAPKSAPKIVEKVQKAFALVVANATDAKKVTTEGSVIKSAQRTAQTACLMTTWCMLQMVKHSCQQELAQISARSTCMEVCATSLARPIVRRLADGSTASESLAARRRMAIVSHAMNRSGGEINVRTHAPQDARTMIATKQTDCVKVNARLAFLETNVTRNAQVGAKVAVATKMTANVKMAAMQGGVVTCVMKLAQKARVLKDATAKLASLLLVSLAVILSKAFFKTGGYARVAQTIATTKNVMSVVCALKDVNSDSMVACACRIAALIALVHATRQPLVNKMDIVQNVRQATLVASAI